MLDTSFNDGRILTLDMMFNVNMIMSYSCMYPNTDSSAICCDINPHGLKLCEDDTVEQHFEIELAPALHLAGQTFSSICYPLGSHRPTRQTDVIRIYIFIIIH